MDMFFKDWTYSLGILAVSRLFLDYNVKHLDFFFCSDHKPILLLFGHNAFGSHCGKVKRVSRFHFEHAWCEDPTCGDILLIQAGLALQVIRGFLVCWIALLFVGRDWRFGEKIDFVT